MSPRFARMCLAVLATLLVAANFADVLAQPQDLDAALKASRAHYDRGDYPAAETEAKTAEQIAKRVFGTDHQNYAAALVWLGKTYKSQGRYAEATSVFQSALKIQERLSGPDHPQVVKSRADIADILSLQGQLGEAIKLYQRVLAVYEKGGDRLTDDDLPALLNNMVIATRN